MQIGRRLLDAAQWESFDCPLRSDQHTAFHSRLVEAFNFQIVHQPVGVIRRRVAGRAVAFAEEQLFAAHFAFRRLRAVETPEEVQLRRGRKIEQLLNLRHVVNLRAAIQNVQPLLGRKHRVAVEVSGALFKFGKVFDGLQRALRAEQSLNVDATQAGRFDAPAIFLRTDVTDQMRRA